VTLGHDLEQAENEWAQMGTAGAQSLSVGEG
jgi:hypothetical protein